MSNSGWPAALAISVLFLCIFGSGAVDDYVKVRATEAEARVKVAQAEATSKQQAILADVTGCSK